MATRTASAMASAARSVHRTTSKQLSHSSDADRDDDDEEEGTIVSAAVAASGTDIALELDEAVIAAVSLAYEAARQHHLQTALRCLALGRVRLGKASQRGRRSFQAWADDAHMLDAAEAHIRALCMAQRTIRQIERLLFVHAGDIDPQSKAKERPQGGAGKGVQDRLVGATLKALHTLQREMDSVEPRDVDTVSSMKPDNASLALPPPPPAATPVDRDPTTPKASSSPAANSHGTVQPSKVASKPTTKASSTAVPDSQRTTTMPKTVTKAVNKASNSCVPGSQGAGQPPKSTLKPATTSSMFEPGFLLRFAPASSSSSTSTPKTTTKPVNKESRSSVHGSQGAAQPPKSTTKPATTNSIFESGFLLRFPPASGSSSTSSSHGKPTEGSPSTSSPYEDPLVLLAELERQLPPEVKLMLESVSPPAYPSKLAPSAPSDTPAQMTRAASEVGVASRKVIPSGSTRPAVSDTEVDKEDKTAVKAPHVAAAPSVPPGLGINTSQPSASTGSHVSQASRAAVAHSASTVVSAPSSARAQAVQASITDARIDDDDSFMDPLVPMRFTDIDFDLDEPEEVQQPQGKAKSQGRQQLSLVPVALDEGTTTPSEQDAAATQLSSEPAWQPDTIESIAEPFQALSKHMSIKLMELRTSNSSASTSAVASKNKGRRKGNDRGAAWKWPIWLPPCEDDLQRVGIWASSRTAPTWATQPDEDGHLGYVPDNVGEAGRLWFEESLNAGMCLLRFSAQMPNAYGSPSYMESLLRQTSRAQRAKVRWLALRAAPGAFATPRVLDEFVADAANLDSIQLFVLPDLEKKSGGPAAGLPWLSTTAESGGATSASMSAGGSSNGYSAAGGGGATATPQVMARLPTNLLTASSHLRRLAIVSPTIRTDFFFDHGALANLGQLEHLTLLLDEGSDVDVDWVKAVLKLGATTLKTVQISGQLTSELHAGSGTDHSSASSAASSFIHGSISEEQADGDDDNDSVAGTDEDGHQYSHERHGTVSSGYGRNGSHARSSSHGHGSSRNTHSSHRADSASSTSLRLMPKLMRLTLEDTSSSGTAAQDLFESMHAPVLRHLVLAGPRLDRGIFSYGITHLSLWPSPGANAHLPAHMSLSRPKQWITRMLMHLESVVHLELGVTQRGLGFGISRGVDTNEIVEGIEQVVVDLEKEMCVLEPESGEAPPLPLGRPLLSSLRSLAIHHLPFDGVVLGRTVMARQKMHAAMRARARMARQRRMWQDGRHAGDGAEDDDALDEYDEMYYEDESEVDSYDDDGDDDRYARLAPRRLRPHVGHAVALDRIRLVKCGKVTEAMRTFLQRHVAEFEVV